MDAVQTVQTPPPPCSSDSESSEEARASSGLFRGQPVTGTAASPSFPAADCQALPLFTKDLEIRLCRIKDVGGNSSFARKASKFSSKSVFAESIASTSASSSFPDADGQSAPVSTYKLKVRLSEIKGVCGVGLFAGEVSEPSSKIVFTKGESIMDIDGTLAMRKRLENGQCLTWLVSGRHCHPISDDSRIIWSNKCYPEDDGCELGCYPRCVAVYSNDSAETSPNVEIIVDQEIPEGPPRQKKPKLESHQLPSYQMVAVRDINENEELVWSYGREGEDDTDYEGKYIEPFNHKKHTRIIIDLSRATLFLPEPITLLEDSNEFEKVRVIQESGLSKVTFSLTESEQKFCDRYALNPRSGLKKDFLKNALKEQHLPAFIKYRFQDSMIKGASLQRSLQIIYGCLRIGAKQLPIGIPGQPITLSAVYGYCVKEGILIPEQDISVTPISWLSDELNKAPENIRLLGLLSTKIRYKLSQPDAIPTQIASLLSTQRVYNPVTQTTKWSASHLETFTLTAANCSRSRDWYKKVVEARPCGVKVKKTVTESRMLKNQAMRGDLESIKIKVSDFIINSGRFANAVYQFQAIKMQLLINGEFTVANSENLAAFIQEHFKDPKDLERMLPLQYRFPTASAKLAELQRIKEVNTRLQGLFLNDLHEMDRDTERQRLSKEFIRFCCERSHTKLPIIAISLLQKTKWLDKKKEDYTRSDFQKLFEEEIGQSWITAYFPLITFSDEEIIERYIVKPLSRQQTMREIRARYDKNQNLVVECFKAEFDALKSKFAGNIPYKNLFSLYRGFANKLQSNKFPIYEMPYEWNKDNAEEWFGHALSKLKEEEMRDHKASQGESFMGTNVP